VTNVARRQHEMDVVAADHDQKQRDHQQKVGGLDGVRRLGARRERRTGYRSRQCATDARGRMDRRVGAGAAFDARRRRDRFGHRTWPGLE